MARALQRCLLVMNVHAIGFKLTSCSWSHPGWWAKQDCPPAYSPDREHVLCLRALPPALRSYQMNRSTVAYFIGNASGFDAESEIHAEARFGYLGIGWQLDGIPTHWHQGLEVVELATARRLKSARPDMRVLVSRQTEVGTEMWNSVAALRAHDPQNERGFWTSCHGKPCAVKWETDESYFFNWNSAELRDWWVNEYIGGALNHSEIDGVYLDCACRTPEGDRLNQGQFQANAQLAVNKAIAMASTLGKTVLTWSTEAGTPHGSSPPWDPAAPAVCAATMRRYIAMGNDSRYTYQAMFKGMGTPAKVTEVDYNNTIGAFLIARGESALLEFPPTGNFPNASQFPFSALLDADYGRPLGTATEVADGSFTREWTRATIGFDCNRNDSARFVFKP